jgi:hypothetical protein
MGTTQVHLLMICIILDQIMKNNICKIYLIRTLKFLRKHLKHLGVMEVLKLIELMERFGLLVLIDKT